jgi:CubicO group peptidase (beta-lactamase class C family)
MSAYPLPSTTLAEAGLREDQIGRLHALIEGHIKAGRYPGAQIAIARHGKLAHFHTFGEAAAGKPATDESIWLLFSNTKVITAAACWVLAEQGAFRFTDRMADHVPEFARNGKGDVTIMQVITHTGGFPNAEVPQAAWEDHGKLREAVCNFSLEFTPGSRLHYHGASAHWALAVLIEQITGQDFRTYIREAVIERIGLGREMFVGLPRGAMARAIEMYAPDGAGKPVPLADRNTPAFKKAGIPGGGGYATARGMVAFYQMMLAGGTIGSQRLVGPRTLQYAIRNWTGDMVDHYMGMPMHRGLGPHLRGTTPGIRGLGSFASPGTFGHGGAGNSYCWADPDSGVSFAYLTNCRIPDPWHSQRLDLVSNFVHSAIL